MPRPPGLGSHAGQRQDGGTGTKLGYHSCTTLSSQGSDKERPFRAQRDDEGSRRLPEGQLTVVL